MLEWGECSSPLQLPVSHVKATTLLSPFERTSRENNQATALLSRWLFTTEPGSTVYMLKAVVISPSQNAFQTPLSG